MVEDELSTVCEEGLEVGVGCSKGSTVDFFSDGDITIEVEGARVPLRVFEDDVFEVGRGDGKRWLGEGIPGDFAAGLEARIDLFVGAGIDRAGVDLARSFDLFGGETGGGVDAFALGDSRIEAAGEGVSNDAILDAVGCVTGIEGGLMEDG